MVALVIQIAVVIILIVLSAFFSSTETALTTVSPHRVRAMAEAGVKKAGTLEKVISQKNKMLSVVLICNNIVNLTASSLTTIIFQKIFGSNSVGVGTGVLTLIILIFGEVSPKTMATLRAEKMSLRCCGVIYGLMVVLTPIAAAINFLAKWVLRAFGVREDEKPDVITEGELRTIVEVSHEEGVIENEEKDIINNIFDFSDKSAHEVMVPRITVSAVNINSTYEEIMKTYEKDMFTRYPVYDESEEEIIGLINVKDLAFLTDKEKASFHVKDVLRPINYTFEQKQISDLFVEMKRNSDSMTVVLDEYGDFAGILTMEDLLEELVGDIRDEYDEDEQQEIMKVADNVYLIHGHVSLDDINEKLGTDFESEDYDSIGGLLMGRLDRLPREGDKITEKGNTIVAYKTDNTYTELVKLVIADPGNEK